MQAKLFLLALALPGVARAQDTSKPETSPEDADPAALQARIAELEAELAQVRDAESAAELKAMMLEARVQALESEGGASADEGIDTNTTFSSGNRSLQALNPEMSVVLDGGATVAMSGFDPATVPDLSGPYFRVADIHYQANFDPFSFFKANAELSPDGVELGEAYMVWTRGIPNTQITLGKFRQQFGVINRWHTPSLDQWDRPLAMNTILTPEGLNDIGLALDTTLPPLWAHSNRVLLQLTQGRNDQLFTGEEAFARPAVLLRLDNYWDLTDSTYLELGLSGMNGANHRPGMESEPVSVPAYDADGNPIALYDADGNALGPLTVTAEGPADDAWRTTWLGGADLTVSWSPLSAQRYRNLTWRTEALAAHKDTADGPIAASGFYTYVEDRVSEALSFGARYDWTQPFAADNAGLHLWQGVAYVSWWQSPWVRTRFQVQHMDGNVAGLEPVDRFTVQVVAAAGPHKHDRY